MGINVAVGHISRSVGGSHLRLVRMHNVHHLDWDWYLLLESTEESKQVLSLYVVFIRKTGFLGL